MLTGHITDALLTIVSGMRWDNLKPADQKIFETVLKEAAAKATADIVKSEQELVAWFKKEGVDVIQVDRAPFREATVKLHNGKSATWDKATYDKVQALK